MAVYFLPCKDTSCCIWQIQGCFTDRTDEPRVNQSLLSCPALYSGFKIIIQFHLSMITCPRRYLLFLAIELILYVRFKEMPRCWFENFGHMAVEIGFLRGYFNGTNCIHWKGFVVSKSPQLWVTPKL